MIYSFLCSIEDYLLTKKLYLEFGDELHRKLLDKSEKRVRMILRTLEGSDYTAALDLLTEMVGSYSYFI